MAIKGIGPQGLGNKSNNGFWVGDGSTKGINSPAKKTVKDACYSKIKASYDVFPSGYASAAIAKCRKNKG